MRHLILELPALPLMNHYVLHPGLMDEAAPPQRHAQEDKGDRDRLAENTVWTEGQDRLRDSLD